MKTVPAAQAGWFASNIKCDLQQGNTRRLTFQCGHGDLILCLSSGFNPAPDIGILETLTQAQEETLLSTQPLRITSAGARTVELRRIIESVAQIKSRNGIEINIQPPFFLPMRVQMWSYDPASGCVFPNLPEHTAYLKAELSYTVTSGFFGTKKITVNAPALRHYPDGFLCYIVGEYEYPLPNRILEQPFKLPPGLNIKLQATQPWRDMFIIRSL